MTLAPAKALTDLQLVRAAALTYAADAPGALPAGVHRWEIEGVHFDYHLIDRHHVFAFRGSDDVEDWLEDARVFPTWSWRLKGLVHSGFYAGMPQVLDFVRHYVVDLNHVAVTGHSLGAARAVIFAGMLATLGVRLSRVSVFGEPKSDFGNIGRLLAGVEVRSYRNRQDPIAMVPRLFYRHAWEIIPIDGGPGPDPIDPFNDHHMRLYVAGMENRARWG